MPGIGYDMPKYWQWYTVAKHAGSELLSGTSGHS